VQNVLITFRRFNLTVGVTIKLIFELIDLSRRKSVSLEALAVQEIVLRKLVIIAKYQITKCPHGVAYRIGMFLYLCLHELRYS